MATWITSPTISTMSPSSIRIPPLRKEKGLANYLRLKLNGTKENPSAFGAKIELWSEGSYQFQENYLSRGYISSVDPVLHFGLGKHKLIDSVKVSWPTSGKVTLLKSLEANQIIEVDVEEISAKPRSDILQRLLRPPRFQKAWVIGHFHQQDDYNRLLSLPEYPSSQVLPDRTQDAEGRPQRRMALTIVVGATNTNPTRVFLKDGQSYKESEIPGLTGEKNFSEAGFAILGSGWGWATRM